MPYQAVARRYANQPLSEIFAFFPFDRECGENWETPFERLIAMAKKEPWNFVRLEFQKPGVKFPVLHNYLNYTFLRLQEQDKIAYAADGKAACFNTGLLTPDEKEIFALFSRHNRAGQDNRICDWFCKGFYDSYSDELTRYRPNLPHMATYIENAAELVFDIRFDVDVNVGHMLDDPENQMRLPEVLRNNRTLALAAIEGATRFLKLKVVRNYKTAIPQWYTPDHKIQLLLPLCLVSEGRADLALVADKDEAGKVYRIRTALRMDMAYNNARLITRPDREWLDP